MKKSFTITTLIVLVALLAPTAALAQAPSCEFEYTVQAGDWFEQNCRQIFRRYPGLSDYR